jgi:hypothetical protein
MMNRSTIVCVDTDSVFVSDLAGYNHKIISSEVSPYSSKSI